MSCSSHPPVGACATKGEEFGHGFVWIEEALAVWEDAKRGSRCQSNVKPMTTMKCPI